MSQTYYQKLWTNAQKSLKENLDFEENLRKKKGSFQDADAAKWPLGYLFVNYIQIARKFDKCYDQMIHPQKRELLGRLLDLTLGRLLELKADLTKIECDNYCCFDNILFELKLTHQDLEIQTPQYFSKDKERIKVYRKKLISLVFEEAEKEKFRINYLKNVPEEGREEAWEKYLAKEEQQRQEKEKLEEQQKKLMGGKAAEMSSLEKLVKEIKDFELNRDDKMQQETILMLQRHERARQGRVRATWAEKHKRLKEQGAFAKKIDESIADKAARIIQISWRRRRRKVRDKRKQNKIMELLGIQEESFKDVKEEKRLENTERLRRKIREKYQKEFEEAFGTIKRKIKTFYSIQMEEDIIEEIRNWFHWFFEMSNYFPDYPPEDFVMPTKKIMGVPKVLGPDFAEKAFPQNQKIMADDTPTTALAMALCGLSALAGSALVAAGHWIEPQEFLTCQKAIEKGIKIESDKKVNELNKPKPKPKQMQKDFQLKKSNFLAPLKKAENDFRITWANLDESKNFEQKYIYSMLKDEKCWELSMEIREQIDKMMRLELELLKEALEKDRNPKKKKRKNKNPKPKKEKKKKEKKDLTENRSLDDLFMELFKNGIIKDYEEVHLKDFMGEKSYCAYEFRRKNEDWFPSPGDVKDIIQHHCILPLGSSIIHQLAPLVKSVCLLGTENSGKKFLARIICSETAAVLFDLSPANVVDKYRGKSGLKMLEHLVEKMSRMLQPSVIFVDETEKTFYKKVPKEEKHLDPKRMANILKKLIKGIKPNDQILVLGICSQPWLANRKKLLKTYQQLIYVPQMDYASYFNIWHKLLTPHHCVPREFDTSSLSKVSNGFSAKAIINTVGNVLTIQRITKSNFFPLNSAEFLEELLKSKLVDENNLEKCLKFYKETDLPKKRAKKLLKIKEELEKANKK